MVAGTELISLEAGSWLQLKREWAADIDLETLHHEVEWQQHRLQLFGREVLEPRLSAWIGDPHCSYRYSGRERLPAPWPTSLITMRQRLESDTGFRFNCVLANRYRQGSDSMGWHSDDEPELGPAPVVASVSLGQPRRFLIRSKKQHRMIMELTLGQGDLLIMGGNMQDCYQHSIAKTKKTVLERINLTFRQIH